jgi:catechol 2,3-dioxygenase-like lactoylglutathione lyase family enzyme
MPTRFTHTKLVVNDVEAAERFYTAIGLTVLSRNIGGEGDVHQSQCWLSATGEEGAHILILTQFLDLPPCPRTDYPGEIWLAITVDDVDAAIVAVEREGGVCRRPGADQPDWGVRAAVVTDHEGHVIELVGPIKQG